MNMPPLLMETKLDSKHWDISLLILVLVQNNEDQQKTVFAFLDYHVVCLFAITPPLPWDGGMA